MKIIFTQRELDTLEKAADILAELSFMHPSHRPWNEDEPEAKAGSTAAYIRALIDYKEKERSGKA